MCLDFCAHRIFTHIHSFLSRFCLLFSSLSIYTFFTTPLNTFCRTFRFSHLLHQIYCIESGTGRRFVASSRLSFGSRTQRATTTTTWMAQKEERWENERMKSGFIVVLLIWCMDSFIRSVTNWCFATLLFRCFSFLFSQHFSTRLICSLRKLSTVEIYSILSLAHLVAKNIKISDAAIDFSLERGRNFPRLLRHLGKAENEKSGYRFLW